MALATLERPHSPVPNHENPPAHLPKSQTLPDAEATRVMIRRDQQKQPSLWTDLWELTKPEISFVVAISAAVGYMLGSPAGFNWLGLLHTLIGVSLSSAGGAVLNHYIERDLDAKMHRTARRPLPAERLKPLPVLIMGLSMCVLGVSYVWLMLNPLTTYLSAATIVLYVGIYTPLKRMTKYNTLVGTIPGALPALGGYTAATGEVGEAGLILFGILVCWQMPHFLALAWMYRKDYERGGFKMLPVMEPDGRSTGIQTVLYTALLVGLSLTLMFTGQVGGLYLSGAIVLGSYFLTMSLRFYYDHSHHSARKVLLTSVMYIPALLLCIVLDRFV